ncbi:MAG: ABC transporter ATP-binding protein [Paludibacteraceae bacterium]|nr:ABC transporter ATP-binding protein [Paludibacteraceae bacterium]
MIHLEHVYKSFGKQEVLHDICLDIQDGEVVGLLGPNGAGKSTLMKIMLGLWKADSGVVEVPSTHGYLPELNPLYDYMFVREYLAFMLRVESSKCKEDSKKRPLGYSSKSIVEEMIERVGLTPMANKRIGELSKGYRQRVGLAQAMMGDPELLILDEPTTGLDPNQLSEIREVIGSRGERKKEEGRRIEEGGQITILSTHILQEVEQMCSRIIILDEGRIKWDSTQSTIHNPQSTLEDIFRQVTNYGK